MSDSDSRDSDEGIRYKTESVRRKRMKSESEGDKNSKECTLSDHSKKIRLKVDQNKSILTVLNDRHINNKVTLLSTNVDELDKSSFGPSLPPNFKVNLNSEIKTKHVIGPTLPPHLLKTDDTYSTQVKNNFAGPQLPSDMLQSIGSNLSEPENLIEEQSTNISLPSSSYSSQESKNFVGPTLPPHLQKNIKEENESPVILGPKLPPSFENFKSKAKVIGPALPSHSFQNTHVSSDENNDECYGPLPSGMENYSKAQQALEERALQLKIDQLDPKSNNEPVRETWMLELPEAKASNFGLGPRQFRSKAGPDLSDRSSWTDTPNSKDKTKKPSVNLQQEAANKELKKRDKEQDSLVKKHKKRDKSLVEMHQDKLNEEKKKIAGPSERRPFSREIDLQVNRFDEAQKKAVLKKAQLLDDRFSSGKAKYL